MGKVIKVLVVDDSAIVRKILSQIISSDPEMKVIGVAPDPYVARDLIVQSKPDVITLDIEMPKLDGITFLQRLMEYLPIPTLIVSSLSKVGSVMALKALESGAVDVIQKPSIDVKHGLDSLKLELLSKIKIASKSRVMIRKRISKNSSNQSLGKTTHQIVSIASSTGGTEALKDVVSRFPADMPGVVIVQHMPPNFTKAFAESLNQVTAMKVKEACQGDKILPGQILLAPGNYHLEVKRSGGFYYVHLNQDPPLHGVRPAADYMFSSIAKVAGSNAIGIVLTGMGKDGAKGLLELHKTGAMTFAQDEKSCVVFGMPREAIEIGAVDYVESLDRIGDAAVMKMKYKVA